MSTVSLDICVTLFCLSLSAILYNFAGGRPYTTSQGYILKNQVTHSRLLPVEAAHAFTYPTLAFLVSLNALESRRLDLVRGWVFGYGGLWGRITGIRPEPYLTKQPGSIRKKLVALLEARGYVGDKYLLEDAWMLTMPSYLGFEGINPLTVYFCYNPQGILWSAVLEIHNTFGESHVHVLEVDRDEDPDAPRGYDHQWTFPREFHVSPFNDRSGFYTVAVKRPTHSPMAEFQSESTALPPKPAVRVHLYIASSTDPGQRGQLKLSALLRPTEATPLTSPSLLFALFKAPFALFLSMPRILFMAWKLHYQKRLDVFIRPEPIPGVQDWSSASASESQPSSSAGGVKWLDEGALERFARRRVIKFLRRRTREMGMEVTLVAADPSMPRLVISPDERASATLTISYLSAKIFTILLLSPSAEHAMLLGTDTEGIFRVSSKHLFLALFSSSDSASEASWLQRLRCWRLPRSLHLSIPSTHFLDQSQPLLDSVAQCLVICAQHCLDLLEKSVFLTARARVVGGQEPWKQWDRAASVLQHGRRDTVGSAVGSVIRL